MSPRRPDVQRLAINVQQACICSNAPHHLQGRAWHSRVVLTTTCLLMRFTSEKMAQSTNF